MQPFALNPGTTTRRSFSASPHFAAVGRVYSEPRLYKRKSYGKAGPMHARGAGEFGGNSPMLRVECQVGTSRLDAFVDTGAQVTVMSLECAQRCGLMSLVDKRFTGNAKGVGSTRIVGRIDGIDLIIGPPQRQDACNDSDGKLEGAHGAYHGAENMQHKRVRPEDRLHRNGRFFSGRRYPPVNEPPQKPVTGQVRLRDARLMILEDLDLDMLIGMDLLRQGECEICIRKNVLRFVEGEYVNENIYDKPAGCRPKVEEADNERVVVEVPFMEDAKQIKVATVQASHDKATNHASFVVPRQHSSSASPNAKSVLSPRSTVEATKDALEYDQYGRPKPAMEKQDAPSPSRTPHAHLRNEDFCQISARERRMRLPSPPRSLQSYRWKRNVKISSLKGHSTLSAKSLSSYANGEYAPAYYTEDTNRGRSTSAARMTPVATAREIPTRRVVSDARDRDLEALKGTAFTSPVNDKATPDQPTPLAEKVRQLRNGEDLQGM